MKGGGGSRVAGLDELELVVGDWECRCPEQQQQQVSSRSEQTVSLAPSQGVYLVYCLTVYIKFPPFSLASSCARKFSARPQRTTTRRLSLSVSLLQGQRSARPGSQLGPPPNELTSHTHAMSHLAACAIACALSMSGRRSSPSPKKLAGTRPLPGHCIFRDHFASSRSMMID